MFVQTYANLVSVYMEDDVNTELAELEEFRKQLEPTSMANQSKLRSMQTDLQVGQLLGMLSASFLPSQPPSMPAALAHVQGEVSSGCTGLAHLSRLVSTWLIRCPP